MQKPELWVERQLGVVAFAARKLLVRASASGRAYSSLRPRRAGECRPNGCAGWPAGRQCVCLMFTKTHSSSFRRLAGWQAGQASERASKQSNAHKRRKRAEAPLWWCACRPIGREYCTRVKAIEESEREKLDVEFCTQHTMANCFIGLFFSSSFAQLSSAQLLCQRSSCGFARANSRSQSRKTRDHWATRASLASSALSVAAAAAEARKSS